MNAEAEHRLTAGDSSGGKNATPISKPVGTRQMAPVTPSPIDKIVRGVAGVMAGIGVLMVGIAGMVIALCVMGVIVITVMVIWHLLNFWVLPLIVVLGFGLIAITEQIEHHWKRRKGKHR